MVSGNPEDDFDTCRRSVTGGNSRVYSSGEQKEPVGGTKERLNRGSQHFTILSLSLTVDQGTGEAYCLAHYLTVGGRK
jgi:hypothetical protein